MLALQETWLTVRCPCKGKTLFQVRSTERGQVRKVCTYCRQMWVYDIAARQLKRDLVDTRGK